MNVVQGYNSIIHIASSGVRIRYAELMTTNLIKRGLHIQYINWRSHLETEMARNENMSGPDGEANNESE